MTTQAQAAGELYSRARDAVMEGGVRIGMIVNHIITMVNGWSKYPAGHLWRDREVPPEGKVVHLDRFEDYLLKPPREGLGLPSLLTLHNILMAHRRTDEAEQALAILRQQIPDYDDRVARERAKLEVEKVRPSKTHEEAGRLGGRGKKAIDNINGFTEKTKGGTSKSYLLSRLKRDASEEGNPQRLKAMGLLRQIERVEITARHAALAMGYIKPADPVRIIKRALTNLTADEAREVWLELQRMTPAFAQITSLDEAKATFLALDTQVAWQFLEWATSRASESTG